MTAPITAPDPVAGLQSREPRLKVKNLRTQERGPYSFSIDAGECISVQGASGSGKSLLLRAIADLDIHQGLVLLDGTSCKRIPAPQWRREVALLPVESQWWFDTVGAHFPSTDCPYLNALGFTNEALGWQVSRLSSGEKQRLALARALMNQPCVLLLDEPTASLDKTAAKALERLIANYRVEHQAAVLWVSHDTRQAARVANRQFKLEKDGLRETRS